MHSWCADTAAATAAATAVDMATWEPESYKGLLDAYGQIKASNLDRDSNIVDPLA